MSDDIGAIDQGTTSTRRIVFDLHGRVAAQAQQEHRQIYPRPGGVAHDALEIWTRTKAAIPATRDGRGQT